MSLKEELTTHSTKKKKEETKRKKKPTPYCNLKVHGVETGARRSIKLFGQCLSLSGGSQAETNMSFGQVQTASGNRASVVGTKDKQKNWAIRTTDRFELWCYRGGCQRPSNTWDRD